MLPSKTQSCRCLILSGLGSEIRQFILSGFAERFKEVSGSKVLFSSRLPLGQLNEVGFAGLVEQTEWIGTTPQACVPPWRVTRLADSIYARQTKRRRFSYSSISPESGRSQGWVWRASSVLAPLPGIDRVLRCLETATGNRVVRSTGLKEKVARVSPDVVVLNTPRSTLYRDIQFACSALKIPVVCIYHTWKDLDVNPRFGFPVDLHLVWNEDMKARILSNYHPKLTVDASVVGSLYHDRYRLKERVIDRFSFLEQIGLEPGDRFLLYTAADPRAVPGEIDFVRKFLGMVTNEDFGSDLKLIIRLNPMDAEQRMLELADDNVRVLAPEWKWEPEENWNSSTDYDLTMYVSLLAHAEFTVGIPSTTSIDSILFGTRVVNVAGEISRGLSDSMAHQIWGAPFYRELRNAGVVCFPQSPQEALRALKKEMGKGRMGDEEILEGIGSIVGPGLGGAVGRSVTEILARIGNFPTEGPDQK